MQNEDPIPRKDAFWAGGKPALAREPNPAYTEGMIRVTGTTMGIWGLYYCYFLRMGVGLVHVETLPDNQGKKKAKRQDLTPSPMIHSTIKNC